MKKLSLAALITCALMTSVHAQILSAAVDVTSDSQVINSGPVFASDAVDFTGAGDASANGVTFSGTDPQNGITFDPSQFFATGAGIDNPAFTSNAFTPELATILQDNVNDSSAVSFSFSGLSAGTYVLQLFAGSTHASGSETVTDGTQSTTLLFGSSAGATAASFVTDTFTTLGGSETITLTPVSGGNIVLSAVNLEEAPEPSTYAMMGLGLLALVAVRRFRRLSA